MVNDALLVPKGAVLFDRRKVPAGSVDIDPACPMRRASDRHPMSNVLILQDFKQSGRRFSGAPLTGFGTLA